MAAARRVTFNEHEEAEAVRAKIKALHPDILDRLPDGLLYRYVVGTQDMRGVLVDYLAADRVAAAWARKRPARDADLERLERAVEMY